MKYKMNNKICYSQIFSAARVWKSLANFPNQAKGSTGKSCDVRFNRSEKMERYVE